MISLFSPKWWISTAIQTFIIMCFIVLFKNITSKVSIPVVGSIAETV